MHPAKQILCIHLPQWSITRYCRRHPECRDAVIAIVQSSSQRRQVIVMSNRAAFFGVRTGMSPAEAKALCGQLACIEQDLPADRRALNALGRWMTRFTPIVANGWDDAAETIAALFLDLTGCERLFGGVEPIVRLIRQALNRFNIVAHIAVAPTPGAAWAFAVSGNTQDRIVNDTSLKTAIYALPVTSLRLDDSAVTNLHQLGLHHVGDLLAISRDQFPSRFGPSLLLRLDQLTGEHAELLTKLIHEPLVTARMQFDAPVESLEAIQLIFEKLLESVLNDLARRNHGVRRMRLIFEPDRGWARDTIVRIIFLSRAHRHRATLLNLLDCETERVDCEHGFIGLGLDIVLHEPVADSQAHLFEERPAQEQMELEQLFQRLRSRLGEAAVIRPTLVESYLPERAWRPTRDGEEPITATTSLPPRPMTLFKTPVEIRVVCEPSDDRTGQPRQFTWQGNVHRLTHIIGPERIAGEWWRGHHRTRDYYEVEDQIGLRFWMFRVLHVKRGNTITARWFLHGRFD